MRSEIRQIFGQNSDSLTNSEVDFLNSGRFMKKNGSVKKETYKNASNPKPISEFDQKFQKMEVLIKKMVLSSYRNFRSGMNSENGNFDIIGNYDETGNSRIPFLLTEVKIDDSENGLKIKSGKYNPLDQDDLADIVNSVFCRIFELKIEFENLKVIKCLCNKELHKLLYNRQSYKFSITEREKKELKNLKSELEKIPVAKNRKIYHKSKKDKETEFRILKKWIMKMSIMIDNNIEFPLEQRNLPDCIAINKINNKKICTSKRDRILRRINWIENYSVQTRFQKSVKKHMALDYGFEW